MATKKTTQSKQLDLFTTANTTQLLNGQIAMIEKKILALFGSTYKYAAQLAQVRDAVNSGNASFTFQSNPAAAKEIENRLNAIAQTLDQQLAKSTQQSYTLGQASTNNALVHAFGNDKQTKKELKEISDDAVAAMRKRGADGHTFYTQPQGGVTISDRVWKLTESTKLEIEIAIQNAALEGQSADELARTIQQYLVHPERLFRSIRVKDPATGEWTGEYTMSEAAKRCHTGQGVYRSSYKNALRLARTELTQAYRRAEWETYQDNPLITGYRIELSNNHTTEVMTKKGRKTIPLKDICDKMAGTEYPKTFLWTGWHPQCRCRMVPILVTKNDFKERVKARHTGKLKEWQPKEQTTEMPKVFVEWVNDNKSRWQANGKAAPFFIRDNYQQGDVDKGLDTRITAAIEQAKQALRPQITEFDFEIKTLRDVAWKYDFDLTQLEQLRAESKDRVSLEKEVKKWMKEWTKKSREIQKATNQAHKAMNELQGKRDELAKLEPTAPELTKFDTAIKDAKDIRDAFLYGHRGKTMKYNEEIAEHLRLADKLNQLVKEADAAIAKVKPAPTPTADNFKTNQYADMDDEQKLNYYINRITALLRCTRGLLITPTWQDNRTDYQNAIASKDTARIKKAIKDAEKNEKLIVAEIDKRRGNDSLEKQLKAYKTGVQKEELEPDVTPEELAAYMGIEETEAKKYKESVKNFTYEWDYEIRAHQQGKRVTSKYRHSAKKIREHAKRVEEFIERAPRWEGGTTYRGIAISNADLALYKTAGFEFDMRGTASWSTTERTAKAFANKNIGGTNINPVIFECRNTQPRGTSIRGASKYEGEHEILCSKTARWRVISITRMPYNTWRVVCEPIN